MNLVSGCLLAAVLIAGRATSIEGFAWPASIAQGQPLTLHVSTDSDSFDVAIVRVGGTDSTVATVTGVPGSLQAVPDSAWQGSGWIPSLVLDATDGWPSGVYHAELEAPGAQTRYASFVVREDQPGTTGRILVQASLTTWHAYDSWGGKSFYDIHSTDGQRATTLSYQRPFLRHQGRGLFEWIERDIARWLENEGYAVEYCTDVDTHAMPDLHESYDLLLVSGHDEYWSWDRRQAVEDRLNDGGDVAIFGGNCCWWQVRLSPDLSTVTCYKDPGLDPLLGVSDSLVTVHWRDPPVNRPENVWTGASLYAGGNPTGDGSYTVERPDHWLLAGTALGAGETFGLSGPVVGVEVDGALFTRPNGFPVPTGADGTPSAFEIVATAPATFGAATMGTMTIGGEVFNAASITWGHGLRSDPTTQRIAENVLSRFVPAGAFASDSGDVVLDDVRWSSTSAGQLLTLSFANTNPAAGSRGVHGLVRAYPFGNPESAGDTLAVFSLSTIPPLDNCTVSISIADSLLPPTAVAITDSLCSAGNVWNGGVWIRWRETGTEGVVETRDVARTSVCPAGQSSAVRVSLPDTGGMSTWAAAPPSVGWETTLASDAGGAPGASAPNPLPTGSFDGWIVVSADSTVGPGISEEVVLWIDEGGAPRPLTVEATTCGCLDPTSVPEPHRPDALRILRIQPNPARDTTSILWESRTAGAATVRIYSVAGRMVRDLHLDAIAGPNSVAWNGRDDLGQFVPAGVYFARVEVARDVAVGRVHRIR